MPPVAQVVVPLPIEGPFDYLIPESLSGKVTVGSRVFVPFSRRQLVGFVVGIKAKSSFRQLKPIFRLLDVSPTLDRKVLDVAGEFSQYYGCSLGEALETMLPEALRKPREWTETVPAAVTVPALPSEEWLVHDPSRKLSEPFLFEQITKTIASGRQVILLVPEVQAIVEIQKQWEQRMGFPIAVLNKKDSAIKELEQWQQIREGKISVLLGTRSAVFAPFPALGLIVMFAEENAAYKQEQTPSYHARVVAEMRAKKEGASLVFVSACPSAETFHRFSKDASHVMIFAASKVATLQIVDLSNYKKQFKGTLSFPLQNFILQTLVKGGRVVIFFNRRGFSTQTRCNQCGFVVRCPRCDINLVFQYQEKKLTCHLCGYAADLPTICPQCNGSYMRSVGTGIEKLESEVARLFPQAKVAIYDRETETIPAEANIIVATQAVVPVLEQIQPALIGVLDFDGMINRSDYRSGERAYALLTSFRQAAQEKLLVQTMDPKDYCLVALKKDDFRKFYRQELAARRELGFPPFRHLVAVTARGIKKEAVDEAAQKLFVAMRQSPPSGVEIFESQPDYVPKLRDKYRFTIMFKTRQLSRAVPWIKKILREHKKGSVIFTVNVDP